MNGSWITWASVPLVEGPQEFREEVTDNSWWSLFFDAQPTVQLASAGLFALALFLLVITVTYWRVTDPRRVWRPRNEKTGKKSDPAAGPL